MAAGAMSRPRYGVDGWPYLAHVEDEYAPRLRAAGLSVRTARAPGTFPPQRLLVARR